MKLANYIVLALALFAVSGCEKDVQIIDGKIPAAYLAQAQAYVGTYGGSFDQSSNALTFDMSGDVALLSSEHDLIDARCGSSLGRLLSVGVTQDKNKNIILQNASFEFSPGLCIDIQGRTLDLAFDSNNPITASIYDHSDQQLQCGIVNNPYPTQQCWDIFIPVYHQGSFSR